MFNSVLLVAKLFVTFLVAMVALVAMFSLVASVRLFSGYRLGSLGLLPNMVAGVH